MMDKNLFISECIWENIFIFKDIKIYTPTTNHCLNGITRQSIIEIAKDSTLEVIEKDIEYDELANADEAFFTGTAVEITPITKLDNKLISNGKRGNITYDLQKRFEDIISGKDNKFKHWLTFTEK